jgi:hypothetical protein
LSTSARGQDVVGEVLEHVAGLGEAALQRAR